MNAVYLIQSVFQHITIKSYRIISFIFLLSLSQNVFSQEPLSMSSVLESGKTGKNIPEYRFTNVRLGIDGVLVIKKRSYINITLKNIDINVSENKNVSPPYIRYIKGVLKRTHSLWSYSFKYLTAAFFPVTLTGGSTISKIKDSGSKYTTAIESYFSPFRNKKKLKWC